MPKGDIKVQVVDAVTRQHVFRRLVIQQDESGILSMSVSYDTTYTDPSGDKIGSKPLDLGATQSKMMTMPDFMATYMALRSACRVLLKDHDPESVEE
jgi:hypothetical protein